jgi:hypothetical protein
LIVVFGGQDEPKMAKRKINYQLENKEKKVTKKTPGT